MPYPDLQRNYLRMNGLREEDATKVKMRGGEKDCFLYKWDVSGDVL